MRLGCGKPGTPQHIEELKNHAWFKKPYKMVNGTDEIKDVNELYRKNIPIEAKYHKRK